MGEIIKFKWFASGPHLLWKVEYSKIACCMLLKVR